jgi:hypothetical protein
MGGREVNDLYLTDCAVGAEAVVGEAGRGSGSVPDAG